MRRHGIEIGDPTVLRERVDQRAREVGRELSVGAAEQRRRPAVVGIAHAAETVHGDDDVDAREERTQAQRERRIVAMRRYVPPQVVGLDNRVERRAGRGRGGFGDLRSSLFQTAVQGADADARAGNEALPHADRREELVKHGNLAQRLTSRSRYGVSLAGPGSFGRPSTRSPRMLRWTWSVPP